MDDILLRMLLGNIEVNIFIKISKNFFELFLKGNYTCLAENYLNKHHPVHQSFRLNIWFTEHQLKSSKLNLFQQYSSSNQDKLMTLIILILIFLFLCLFFILSFYCFCLQIK